MILENGSQRFGSSYLAKIEEATRTAPPSPVRSSGTNALQRLSPSSAPRPSGPVTLCARAADAVARRSPAAPDLAYQCAVARAQAVRSRIYQPDAVSPNDPAYRVALEAAGESVVAASPSLASIRASLPSDVARRGFTMAQGVLSGNVDPAFPSWVMQGLPGELGQAFAAALAAPSLDQSAGPLVAGGATSDFGSESEGVPTPVLVGAGVVGVGVLALIVYKLTR